MEILMICPAGVATGGTESIHKFASELNKKENASVRLLYVGNGLSNPQPEAYKHYGCKYITEFPENYSGAVIIPEIWANDILASKYKNCVRAINWAGVDAYEWTLSNKQQFGAFLKDKKIIHLVQSRYAEEFLLGLGVDIDFILPLSDVLNDEFFKPYKERERSNTVLYNPAKMTAFQDQLMKYAAKSGIGFKPLEKLTIQQMAQTMREHKLYIDFGIFPGRERIPREAAMCGCCVLTSNVGAAQYFKDVRVLSKYKFFPEPKNNLKITETMIDILKHYDARKSDWDGYRKGLIEEDRDSISGQCDKILNAFYSV